MLVDPKATRVIKPEEQATKGKNNPYCGMEVPGAVRATFLRGTSDRFEWRAREPSPAGLIVPNTGVKPLQ